MSVSAELIVRQPIRVPRYRRKWPEKLYEPLVVLAASVPLKPPSVTASPDAKAVVMLAVGTMSEPEPVLSMAIVPIELEPIATATLVPASTVSPVTLITVSDVPSNLPTCTVKLAVLLLVSVNDDVKPAWDELVPVVEAANVPVSDPTATVLPAAGVVVTEDVGTTNVPEPLLLIATVPIDVPPTVTATLVPAAAVSPVTVTTDSFVPSRLPV